jgi:competence protein ComEA
VAALGRARGVATRLRRGIASLGGALAYRRQELLVVALLAISVLGGFAVELWHQRAPDRLDQLEAEPPRLAAVTRSPGPRLRSAPPRGRDGPRVRPAARAAAPATPGAARLPVGVPPSAEHPLDLNGATAVELAGLPGIGARLATRILARRAELGGRFASVAELASVPGLGARKIGRLETLVRIASPPPRGPVSETGGAPEPAASDHDTGASSPEPEAEGPDGPP